MLEDLAAKQVLIEHESQRNQTNERLEKDEKKSERVSKAMQEEQKPQGEHVRVCNEALIALRSRSGNSHMKAIDLIDKAIEENEGDPVLHRCKATICTEAVSSETEYWNQTWLRRRAIDSAKKACELSPNSIEFAYFYAHLLGYKASWDTAEYESAIKECERALKIENPIDPAEESFQQEQLDEAAG